MSSIVAAVKAATLQEKVPTTEDKQKEAGHAEKIEELWTRSCTYKINDEIPLIIYTSNRSRLRVAVAETPGPLVKGIFSFVTETHDNDGLPHTLEHLVFMGSKKYPYKGVLDLVANRCLASGTNAFTYQDHTAYELVTIGSQGFLKVLPIYLDHVLSPTLTDAQFLTEVHHINGRGKDAGVVYSEMQECESEMACIVGWRRKEHFYPEYNPYRVETGGRLAALRTTCNMEKIRKFHQAFYHISNLLVTVCGSISHRKLLTIMTEIEETYKQQVPHLFSAPFRNTMMTFTRPVMDEIVCPNEDEKLGMVEIAWKGPSNSLDTLYKLDVLGRYLSETAASPLEQDFVQLENQLASSVSVSVIEQCVSEIVFYFYGVPVDQLLFIKKRLFEKTFPETFEKNFDQTRMTHTITNLIDKKLSQMETHCHDYVCGLLSMHQIYGSKDNTLEKRINHVGMLREMLALKPKDWIGLARHYLTRDCVYVSGRPSRDEANRITAADRERIEEQRKKLGKNGLKRCEEELKKSKHETTCQKPPPELLSEMMIQELEKFSTFEVKTLRALTGQNNAEIFKLPLPVYIHSTKTHFVKFILAWDTKTLPMEMRMWMMLYFELMFQSPAMIDGVRKSYEEVAKLYIRDLISYCGSLCALDRFSRFCSITLKASPDRYVTMLSWLKIFATGIIFEAERAKVAVKQLIAAADEEKRDGCGMRDALLATAIHNPDSNDHIYGVIQLEKFHEDVLKLTEEDPAYVITKLEELRNALTNAPVNVHIICNTDQIMPCLSKELSWLYLDGKKNGEISTDFRDLPGDTVNVDGFGRQRVITVAACESSYLKQSILFKYVLGSEEVLAVQLVAHYLSQVEGPLYNALRGTGLSYGTRIAVDIGNQLLSFSIYRSAQLEQAYEQAKKVVFDELEHMNGEEFEAAKRSFVSEIVQGEDTVISAAHRAIRNQFRGISPDFWREYCERVWNASMEKVLECSRGFIRDLFDDKKCIRAISVPQGKLKDIKKHFKNIEVVQSSDLHVKLV